MPLQQGKIQDMKYKSPQNNPVESSGEQIILATASYDHDIKLWEAPSGQCLRTLQHADSVSFIFGISDSDCVRYTFYRVEF